MSTSFLLMKEVLEPIADLGKKLQQMKEYMS
jgi:hypothetical protein